MEVLILIVLVAILVVLVRGQRVRTGSGPARERLAVPRPPSPLELTSAREHELGMRPCSSPGCRECRLHVARLEPGRRRWRPHESGPRTVDGTIAAVERVGRYGTTVDLYFLDPLVRGDAAWEVEASHVVLAGELARYKVGDRVRIRFQGWRQGRGRGRDYYLYEVRLLP